MPRGKTKFDRCVKAVRRRGGAYDPRAVCGAMRARGELNPGRKRYWVLIDDTHLLGTFATKKAADQYALQVSRQSPAIDKVSVKDSHRSNPATPHQQGIENGKRDAEQSLAALSGASLTDDGTKLGFSGKDLVRYKEGYRKGYSGRRNPAGAAAEAFKRFHGRDPREFVTVTKKIHRHGNLWSLGTLRMLKIRTERGQTVKLSGFKGAYLAANEQAFVDLADMNRANLTQLYIEGGDQSVDLKSFGIDPERAHEVETLGKAIVIDYHTIKVHLGGEGGDAIYRHKFRTTREGDSEVTLRVARYPDVIYRVLDQQLEFSGGSYEISAEGIDK